MFLLSPIPRPFSQEELVRILDGMNIKLSPDTKLGVSKLQLRFHKALDAAQFRDKIFPNCKVNPAYLPLWERHRPLAPVFQQSQTGGQWVASSTRRGERLSRRRVVTDVKHEELFGRLLENIGDISVDLDEGNRHISVMLKNDDAKRIIFLRVRCLALWPSYHRFSSLEARYSLSTKPAQQHPSYSLDTWSLTVRMIPT